MGHTILISVVRFTAVPPGVPTALPHGINIEQSPRIPDRLDLGPSTQPFSAAADLTNVTVTNLGGAAADIDVWCELEHSIQRVIASDNLTPQPFIAGGASSGGGGATSLNLIDGTKVAPSLNYVSAALPTGYFRETDLGTGLAGSVLSERSMFVGYGDPAGPTAGLNNTFLGYKAGRSVTAVGALGYHNTLIGSEAGSSLTSGNLNTLIGSRAGLNLTTARRNTIVGVAGGGVLVNADDNTLVGYHAGVSLTQAENVIVGCLAAEDSITAQQNVFIGARAAKSNVAGDSTVAVGYSAGENQLGTDGVGSVLIGFKSGFGAAASTAYANNFVGEFSGFSITSGNKNNIYGRYSGYPITSGNENTMLGNESGFGHTTADGCVYVGHQAGYTDVAGNANVSGSYNTFLGYQSGPGSATQRARATAVGYRAKVDLDDCVVLGAPNTRFMAGAVTSAANAVDAALGLNQYTVSLDAGFNNMFIRVRDGGGAYKTGTIALV